MFKLLLFIGYFSTTLSLNSHTKNSSFQLRPSMEYWGEGGSVVNQWNIGEKCISGESMEHWGEGESVESWGEVNQWWINGILGRSESVVNQWNLLGRSESVVSQWSPLGGWVWPNKGCPLWSHPSSVSIPPIPCPCLKEIGRKTGLGSRHWLSCLGFPVDICPHHSQCWKCQYQYTTKFKGNLWTPFVKHIQWVSLQPQFFYNFEWSPDSMYGRMKIPNYIKLQVTVSESLSGFLPCKISVKKNQVRNILIQTPVIYLFVFPVTYMKSYFLGVWAVNLPQQSTRSATESEFLSLLMFIPAPATHFIIRWDHQ